MTQKDINAVIDRIYKWRAEFAVGKELFRFLNQNLTTFNDIERAAAFFIFNRITFSGTTLSGGFSESAFLGRYITKIHTTAMGFERIKRNLQLNLSNEQLLAFCRNKILDASAIFLRNGKKMIC